MQRVFHKKKFSQLKSDIRSSRCKNFSLKRASGLTGGGGGSPWIYLWHVWAQLFGGRLALTWGFRLKAFSLIIFLCYFKDIQSSYLNSNFAPTLGYLDPALNNPSMVSNLEACHSDHMLNQVYKRFVTVFWQLIFLNMIVYLFHFTNQAFLGERELKRRDSNNDYRNNKQYTRSLWTILL